MFLLFTFFALKSKQIELLNSVWRNFEDFFKLFPMVTDFNVVFLVVFSQISYKGETIFLTKMVMASSFMSDMLLICSPDLYRLWLCCLLSSP